MPRARDTALLMNPDDYAWGVSAGLFTHRDTVAAVALLVYDYLLTVQQEERYIWKAKWTPGKALFLIVRYLPFLDVTVLLVAMTPGAGLSCNFTSYWEMTGVVVACFFADCVYGLRTWALWSKSCVLGWFLVVCGLGCYVGAIVILLVIPGQSSLTEWRIPGFWGCFVAPSSWDAIWMSFTFETTFQLILLLATLLKGLQHLRRNPENLTTILYRDAIFSCFSQVCFSIINVVLLIKMDSTQYSLNVTYRALLSVLPARIILNIREAVSMNHLDGWDVTVGPEASEAVTVTQLDSWDVHVTVGPEATGSQQTASTPDA